MSSGKNLRFDRVFFNDFWQLCKSYWVSEEKWISFLYLGLGLLCSVGSVRANVALNTFYKELYSALESYNKSAIFTGLIHFFIIMIILMVSFSYSAYFIGKLNIHWRRWLTKSYLNKWLVNNNHYRMQLGNNKIDNPDQRISEDLEKLPDLALTIFLVVFQSILTIVSFSYILWNLSVSIPIHIHHLTIQIPGCYFWGALLYGVFGIYITAWIGRKLSTTDYQQQLYNADFRFSLVKLRESSEQVSMYKGEEVEKEKLSHLFSFVFNNFLNINKQKKNLLFFSNGFSMSSMFLGSFITIPFYLQKKIKLDSIMQVSSAFGNISNAFSTLVNIFGLFADLRAVVSRLTEFNKSIDQLNQFLRPEIVLHDYDKRDFIVSHLSISLPNGKTLLNNINFTFQEGDSVLISGQSGLGKSTLLRALAGVWPYMNGMIEIPKNKKIMFLPQKPYIPLGSLKDVILYAANNLDMEKLYSILAVCKLEKFKSQLDEKKNWSQVLSLGEQQLIAFARLLLSKSDIIFLDEATSALDESTEFDMYELLRMQLPFSTIVSIGHRSSLLKFHKKMITLSKEELAMA